MMRCGLIPQISCTRRYYSLGARLSITFVLQLPFYGENMSGTAQIGSGGRQQNKRDDISILSSRILLYTTTNIYILRICGKLNTLFRIRQ